MSDIKFNTHRPADSSDPGFTLPGRKLRWVNGRVSENNPGRPWVVIRKSELPKELVAHIERHLPNAFKDGDVMRRGDLILGYADERAHKIHKEETRERAQEVSNRVKSAPDIRGRDGRARAKVTENTDEDVTEEMMKRFKNEALK